jgi:2-phospho-L-lactate guanylyltransferase
MMATRAEEGRWTAIVPIKPWQFAKTRLGLRTGARVALARALGHDLLAALAASRSVGRIVIVTAELDVDVETLSRPVTVLRDRPLLAGDMLNPAVVQARCWISAAHGSDTPAVVVPSDIAALTPGCLDEVLATMGRWERAFVTDVCGSGTTLASARRVGDLVPAHGVDSAARYESMGYVHVAEADIRCRLDVDRIDDLVVAMELGTGARVRATVAEHRISLETRDRSSRLPAGVT